MPIDALSAHLSTAAAGPIGVTDRDRRRLVEVLAVVPDPRRRRGVRHRFTPLLAATVCAMPAGARSFAAIADWVADLTETARGDLGLAGVAPTGTPSGARAANPCSGPTASTTADSHEQS